MNEPAFPNPELSNAHYGNPEGYTGLTIRDYFAAAALTGLLTQTQVYENTTDPQAAKQAYDLADAMLEARKHVPPTASPKPTLAAGLEQYKRDTALFA